MPRSVRIEYAGAVYHVMCRGDRREAIFHDDDDRRMMLQTLGEVCGRTGFAVHSYVLMTNHYHLLIETPEPNQREKGSPMKSEVKPDPTCTWEEAEKLNSQDDHCLH